MSVGPRDPDYIIWYHVLLLLWFSPVMWCCFQIISSHDHRLIIWWPYISKNILHLMTSLDLCSTSFYPQLAMSSKGPPPGPGQDERELAAMSNDEAVAAGAIWCWFQKDKIWGIFMVFWRGFSGDFIWFWWWYTVISGISHGLRDVHPLQYQIMSYSFWPIPMYSFNIDDIMVTTSLVIYTGQSRHAICLIKWCVKQQPQNQEDVYFQKQIRCKCVQ